MWVLNIAGAHLALNCRLQVEQMNSDNSESGSVSEFFYAFFQLHRLFYYSKLLPL